MIVKELRKLLNKFNDNDLVVMSKDAEGNSFSPLSDHSNHIYVPDTTYSGEIFLLELTPELKEYGFSDEDIYHGKDGQNAIILWPTN